MPQFVKEIRGAMVRNFWFYAFATISIALIVASWYVPTMGQVDGSVLAAVGEIFAFAALGAVLKAIDKGMDAKVTHGSTSVTIGNLDEQPEELCD